MLALIEKANQHASNTAIQSDGKTYSYQQLLDESALFAGELPRNAMGKVTKNDLKGYF